MGERKTYSRHLTIAVQIAVVILALVAWELLVSAWPQSAVPAPSKAIMALVDLGRKGILLEDLTQSLRRVFVGFALAAAIGTSLGLALGASSKLRLAAIPLIELLRPIPPIAWIPLSMALFGLGDGSAYFVIFVGAFYPILTNTMLGVREVSDQYIDAAKSLGCNNAQCFAKVIWPASLPSIFAGLKVGLGFAWMCVVAAEMIAARSGLGYEIQLNRQLLRLDRVVAGMLVIGVVGFLMNDGLARLERFFLPWRRLGEANDNKDTDDQIIESDVNDKKAGDKMPPAVVVSENLARIDTARQGPSGASVKLSNVSFTHAQAKTAVLKNISLEVAAGEILCILGPSGCGKTTLLRLIAGLENQSSGEIFIDGHALDQHRSEITMVFQHSGLFPWRTAQGNVVFALESKNNHLVKHSDEMKPADQASQQNTALRYLETVGLDNRGNHYPQQLSGGQKQRVALARALAYEPRLLLMDEPFAALDSQTRENLQEELSALLSARKISGVFVTHDIREALFLADRVIVVSKQGGQIIAQEKIQAGQPREASFRYTPEFSEARLKLWNLLKEDTARGSYEK